jgi:hypothetical protein
LAWAFAISIALHLLVFGTYEGGKKLGWWEHWHWPKWMQSVKMLSALLKQPPKTEPPPSDPPLMFVEVNPDQAVAEPPKNSKFYSDKNSKAANPDPAVEANIPKIEGKQTDIVKTEDVPRTKAFPLQPAPPKTEVAKEAREEEKPKPAQPVGDLAMAKPVTTPPTPQKEAGEAPKPRPRTIREAMARQQPRSPLAGQKMKQEGGVPNRDLRSSLDVSSSVFGAYDAAIIAAVQNRWYSLLDERNFAYDRSGRVTLSFRLHADGTVSQIEFVSNDVGAALGLLCQSAIKDPSPYGAWPSDMRRKIGAEYREVTFTFLYY